MAKSLIVWGKVWLFKPKCSNIILKCNNSYRSPWFFSHLSQASGIAYESCMFEHIEMWMDWIFLRSPENSGLLIWYIAFLFISEVISEDSEYGPEHEIFASVDFEERPSTSSSLPQLTPFLKNGCICNARTCFCMGHLLTCASRFSCSIELVEQRR